MQGTKGRVMLPSLLILLISDWLMLILCSSCVWGRGGEGMSGEMGSSSAIVIQQCLLMCLITSSVLSYMCICCVLYIVHCPLHSMWARLLCLVMACLLLLHSGTVYAWSWYGGGLNYHWGLLLTLSDDDIILPEICHLHCHLSKELPVLFCHRK